MSYTTPDIAQFKAYFSRDFPYGTDPATSITDTDIQKAIIQAELQINQCLFSSQGIYDIGFLLLAAHYMVISIQSSSQGAFGQYNWLTNSKTVGSVSQGISIPDRILANPEFAWLTQTNYGAQYLAMVLPQLSGQMFVVAGATLP